MKCLKNVQTGNIIRVDDKQANQMAGNTWQYVSKSEWKSVTRTKTEAVEVAESKGEETKSHKVKRRSEIKAKQRPIDPADRKILG